MDYEFVGQVNCDRCLERIPNRTVDEHQLHVVDQEHAWVNETLTNKGLLGQVNSDHCSLNPQSQTIVEPRLHEATKQGGRAATAMSDQGCRSTSGSDSTPSAFLKGRAQQPSPSKTDSTQVNSLCGKAPTPQTTETTAKRIVLLLNVSLQPQQTAELSRHGVTAVTLQRFGTPLEPTTTLMTAKKLIREGRVVWLHGRVTPQHWTKPT